MSLNFMSVCPYCHKHVEPLRVGDRMDCPLCGGVSELVIETVLDEPVMKKKGDVKMMISKEEMDAILAMYAVTCNEGQETGAMINLVKRIKKRGE